MPIGIIMIPMSITLIIPALIGWLSGLAINYLSDVLPITRRFSQPACLHCGEPLSWQDYLLLRPCKNGHARRARFWVVQIVILVISLYVWIQPPAKLGYWLGALLLVYFGIVFVIDLEHRLILHPTSIFGSLLALTVGLLSNGLVPTLLGGLGGLLIMLAFYFFGVLFARLRAKRMRAIGHEADDEEALGAGDVILVTILGLMLGWPLIWFSLLVGILLGGLVSLLMILWLVVTRRYERSALMVFIPYGPYFITSAFLVIFVPKFLQMFLPA
jgi:hypothetical protein